MKKLIFTILMLFSSISFANRIDSLNAGTDMDYCGTTAEFFFRGADARFHGFARGLRELPKEYYSLLELGADKLPRESMWVINWNDLTPEEQTFMGDIAYQGWDAVDDLIKKNVKLDNEIVEGLGQTYFNGCMYNRTKEKRVSNPIHKTASSRAMYCEIKAKTTYNKCMDAVD